MARLGRPAAAFALGALVATLMACKSSASFSGNTGQAKAPVSTEISQNPLRDNPQPTPAAMGAVATPAPACVNALRVGPVVNPRTGKHFRMLPEALGYCAGAAGCAALAPGGQMVWIGLDVPDEALACNSLAGGWQQNSQNESATLCTPPSGLNFIEPTGTTERNLQAAYPILCVY